MINKPLLLENIAITAFNPERIPKKLGHLTYNKRQVCEVKTKTYEDFNKYGFTAGDIRGLYFSEAQNPALLRAAMSSVKLEMEDGHGSGVIIRSPHEPGGIAILTALHVVQKNHPNKLNFKAFQPASPIFVEINGAQYQIDANRIFANVQDGDFTTLFLKPKPELPNFSPLAADLAERMPEFGEDVSVVGFAETKKDQEIFLKNFTVGRFGTTAEPPSLLGTRRIVTAELVLNPGSSGSGLYNSKGQLIAISSKALRHGVGLPLSEFSRFVSVTP